MFESCVELVDEYNDVEQQLANPGVHGDQAAARQLGRRYAQLRPVVAAYREWLASSDDLDAAREFVVDDPSFEEEVVALERRTETAAERLTELLLPRDPMDDKDVIVEVKAGEGGEESALFASDLARMYTRYAERHGWTAQVIDAVESDLGGFKGISIAMKAKGIPEPGTAPYARLKFEGGVHRVQRVPVTESQGRIHTSAAGVLVLPEADGGRRRHRRERPAHRRLPLVRYPVARASIPPTPLVRITHLPTGVVVSCQNEKSQLQNKESAMRILRARLLAVAEEQAAQEASDARRSQVRTVDRSERIRTYNFAENRISDHRVGFKAYNLDQVLDGDLDDVIDACVAADQATRLTESTA